MKLPRLRSPLDGEDRRLAGVILVLAMLVIGGCATLGLALGLGVRLYTWAAFGG